MVNVRPLVYHYIAWYNDGSKLEQYGKDLGYHGRKFTDIDNDKLIKFGLYPFDAELAEKVNDAGTPVRSIPFLPSYEIEFNKNKRLIYHRQCYISQQEYHICDSCKKEFSYGSNIKTLKSKYSSPICPHCGAYDDFYCSVCGKSYIFEQTSHGLCPKCKGHLKRRKNTSRQYSREKRWNEYVIGYQQLVNGTNVQCLLTINETGSCKVT